AQRVDETIVREREQPGREARAGPIARCCAGHREPYILHQLVSDRTIAQVALQVPPHLELVASIQFLESLRLTAGEAQHEGFVGITSISHVRIVAAVRGYRRAGPERSVRAKNPERDCGLQPPPARRVE